MTVLSDEDFQRVQHAHAADRPRHVQVAADDLRPTEHLPRLSHRQGRGIGREAEVVINERRRCVRHEEIDATYGVEASDIGLSHSLFRPPVHDAAPIGPVDD